MTITVGSHFYALGWSAIRAGLIIEVWEGISIACIVSYRRSRKRQS